jgi:transcription elongation GreA/GreB family factor
MSSGVAGQGTPQSARIMLSSLATVDENLINRGDLLLPLENRIRRLKLALVTGERPIFFGYRTTCGSPLSESEKREVEREIRFLSQLERELENSRREGIYKDRADFGSEVATRDLLWGRDRHYRLLDGPLHPADRSQVSLESPHGRALRGARAGDEAVVLSSGAAGRLRIIQVKTLPHRLGLTDAASRS